MDGDIENEIDDVFLYRADIPTDDFCFCDYEVESVSYIALEEFRKMVESNSFMLLPYEKYYCYFIIYFK